MSRIQDPDLQIGTVPTISGWLDSLHSCIFVWEVQHLFEKTVRMKSIENFVYVYINTQKLVEGGCLISLCHLSSHDNPKIQLNAVWALMVSYNNNILCGTRS